MSEALLHLSAKGIDITPEEAEAVEAAILMHDLGHGPFSHVLEDVIADDISHEEISLLMMTKMNEEMNGRLNLAIDIFKDTYPKRFLHQLVSGQLDVDRLDYLCRDSFYTGVVEGNIGSARIIKMLDVKDDRLVVESKGIYSIENFLTARRLMYWQVYLHKTSVACERMLINTLLRAKELAHNGAELFGTPSLRYFIYNNVDASTFDSDSQCLEHFVCLNDSDIWSALQVWCNHSDRILSRLSSDIINRHIFKVEITDEPVSEKQEDELRRSIASKMSVPLEDAHYLYAVHPIEKNMYNAKDDSIEILYKDGTTKNISEASDMLNISLLSKKIRKYYLCRLRNI
jgi:HD superfamily phosphohydrolase